MGYFGFFLILWAFGCMFFFEKVLIWGCSFLCIGGLGMGGNVFAVLWGVVEGVLSLCLIFWFYLLVGLNYVLIVDVVKKEKG